ncbi:hypothetical protein C818_02621 [Lachnospiraceae bacterium MD308]|nr:hypothetical protein C818_02621 [Lachnospiraceae bacterium MD308]
MKNEWRNQKENARKILPLIHKYREVLLFDTETTGLGKTAKIIQFSAVHYAVKEGYVLEEVRKLDLYINPREPLAEKITEITGITDAMLKDAVPEEEAAPVIFGLLGSCGIWAAYNSPFDLRMLAQMSARTGQPFKQHPCVDVLEMARDFVSKADAGSHKLGDVLATLFPGEDFQFHSAIEDVRATARLLPVFLTEYRKVYSAPAEQKRQLRLEWAKPWQNPKMPSQQRIRLMLNEGQYGDIYWDIVGHCWGCKATKSAKALFGSIDLANIETQVLNRYGWKFDAKDMSALSKNWLAELRKKSA